MRQWPELVLMGQDIADYGGYLKRRRAILRITGAFAIRPYVKVIVGNSMGYAIAGGKSMMEMQFADFVTTGFNQIVNNLRRALALGTARRCCCSYAYGCRCRSGTIPQPEYRGLFTHVPGLKVVYPAYPAEAALLLASFNDPNPIMFFEHKALYRTVKEEVPSYKQVWTLEKHIRSWKDQISP